MDLLFLPKTAQKEDKRVAHFTFKSYYLPKTGNFQYSGFSYVGKNTSHIERLINMYKRGYAAESLESVKAELTRSLENEKNSIPEVIICEAKFEFAAIRSFIQFLNQNTALSSIPFILDGSGLSEKEVQQYRRQTRPDEILFLNHCEADALQTKIRFLRKMKSGRAKSATPRIEERQLQGMASGPLLKRLFDILISAIALIILSPLFLLIALAIKLESSGPVFYISKRAGRGYRIFNFFKFRTMEHGADKKINELTHLNQYGFNNNHRSPVFFKISNDPRITRVGSFLRNTSLDELPQLINVFLGNMSLVGNRPLPLYEAVALTTDDYAARFMAPAGITGLWQIKKRGNKDMSAEERIHIDIDYASKCNFVYDLWIIANTPSALLQKENV
ncbi:MAG: sugar transferase [Bacteroidota bacterium]|nr:sugar transferase [Bacteroidota bacterium]MDP4256582.1 sugar transferase [Bacteroidota bacterium]